MVALSTSLPGTDVGTMVSGMRLASDIAATTLGRQVPQIVKDYAIDVSADYAPLIKLLNDLKPAMQVKNSTYYHFQDDILPMSVGILSFSTDGDGTGIVLESGHGSRVKVKDVLCVPRTRELLYISAISTDTLTVTRSYGEVAATTLTTSDQLDIMSNVHAENTGAPDAISNEPTIKTNSTQIAKQSIELGGRALQTETFTGDEWKRLYKKALQHLNMKREQTLFHGDYVANTATGGLDYWVSTNLTNVAGTLTEATLNTFLKTVFRRNDANRNQCVFIAGELIFDAFQRFGTANITTRPSDGTLGSDAIQYKTPHGSIRLVKHGALTVNTYNAGLGYFINMDKCNLVEMQGRGLQYHENVQANDYDSRKDYFLSDFGLWLGAEKCFGKLYGVTG